MYQVLSIEKFPAVHITYFPANMEETEIWLNEMSAVFAKEEDFVLFYPPYNTQRLTNVDEETVHAMRKHVVLWIKKHKPLYAAFCKGIVLPLHPENDDRALIEKQCQSVEGVYKVPARILERGADEASLVQSLMSV